MDKKRKDVHAIKTTSEGLVALSTIRNSPEWAGILALRDSFIEKWKNDAFSLNEADPQFPIKHAQIAAKTSGVIAFIKFIDEAPTRLEDKFVEQVKQDKIKSIINPE